MPESEQDKDRLFMQRAMELALHGMGHVSPNPLVGAVIVYRDSIIAEGWHKEFGGPHAEVNVVESVADKSVLPECTLYVNLEPCSHYGKTPPCSEMLIANKIGRVVFANLDSNPLVSGEGAHQLREAGIHVTQGVCEKEGRDLNKRFFTYFEKKRPFVVLKWAETTDGFMARNDLASKWITGELARQVVHKWRTEEDAVLVGTTTARVDNPYLNVRDWTGRNPVRVVIDRDLKLDPALHLFDGSQATLCYNVLRSEEEKNVKMICLSKDEFLRELLRDLYNRDIQSVMIEGGAHTLQHFIQSGAWDEARVWIGNASFGGGVHAPALQANLVSDERVGKDTLKIFHPL